MHHRSLETPTAESIPDVYILEACLNGRIAFFGKDDPEIVRASAPGRPEKLQYIFPSALGDRYSCAHPSPMEYETLEFNAKIQLQLKRDKSGSSCE